MQTYVDLEWSAGNGFDWRDNDAGRTRKASKGVTRYAADWKNQKA